MNFKGFLNQNISSVYSVNPSIGLRTLSNVEGLRGSNAVFRIKNGSAGRTLLPLTVPYGLKITPNVRLSID